MQTCQARQTTPKMRRDLIEVKTKHKVVALAGRGLPSGKGDVLIINAMELSVTARELSISSSKFSVTARFSVAAREFSIAARKLSLR